MPADVRAGAALMALDLIIRDNPPWLGCWRMRLALAAAASSARLLRVDADEALLRDALHLTRAGDDPGPAGRLHLLWRRLASRPIRFANEVVTAIVAEAGDSDAAREVAALMQVEAELATTLGWAIPLPLAATVIGDPRWREGREKRAFRVGGESWEARRIAVIGLAAVRAHALAVDLARRADVAIEVSRQLRTRDGGAGAALVLADDCVAPWRMVAKSDRQGAVTPGFGSDRAARRFCDSLHAFGALRLVTDRPTFRLYGL